MPLKVVCFRFTKRIPVKVAHDKSISDEGLDLVYNNLEYVSLVRDFAKVGIRSARGVKLLQERIDYALQADREVLQLNQ